MPSVQEKFVLVVGATLLPAGLAGVRQQRDGQLIKQRENGLHEKLIRLIMKGKQAGLVHR